MSFVPREAMNWLLRFRSEWPLPDEIGGNPRPKIVMAKPVSVWFPRKETVMSAYISPVTRPARAAASTARNGLEVA